MRRPVTDHEWEMYRKRQLTAEEMLDVSQRLKEFGRDGAQPAPDPQAVLLRLAPPAGEPAFNDETLSDYVTGSLDKGERDMVDEARLVDPVLDNRVSAMEAVERQVKASLETVAHEAPRERKNPLMLVLGSTGWLAAAASLTVLAVVLPRMNERLGTAERGLKQANDRIVQLSSRQGTIEPGDIFGTAESRYGDYAFHVPDGSKYVESAGALRFETAVDEAGAKALATQKVDWPSTTQAALAPLRPELAGPVTEAWPSGTLVRPGTVDRLAWTTTGGAGDTDVTLTGPAGETVLERKGVTGGLLRLLSPLTKPGNYTWTLALPGATSRFRFVVVEPTEADQAVKVALAAHDPLSRGVLMAQAGFVADGLGVVDRLLNASPGDNRLVALRRSLVQGP